MNCCDVCDRELDRDDDPSTEDCGGTCLRCMAEFGDPDCQRSMRELGLDFEGSEDVE